MNFLKFLCFILASIIILMGAFCLPHQPQVVVNMPADAKPLEQLPADTKIINNDKAILWWTVYKSTLDRNHTVGTCIDAANYAVKNVYNK